MTKRYVAWTHHITLEGSLEWDDDRSPEQVIDELSEIHETVLEDWIDIITLEHEADDETLPNNS